MASAPAPPGLCSTALTGLPQKFSIARVERGSALLRCRYPQLAVNLFPSSPTVKVLSLATTKVDDGSYMLDKSDFLCYITVFT